jgi:hypothetical protein
VVADRAARSESETSLAHRRIAAMGVEAHEKLNHEAIDHEFAFTRATCTRTDNTLLEKKKISENRN